MPSGRGVAGGPIVESIGFQARVTFIGDHPIKGGIAISGGNCFGSDGWLFIALLSGKTAYASIGDPFRITGIGPEIIDLDDRERGEIDGVRARSAGGRRGRIVGDHHAAGGLVAHAALRHRVAAVVRHVAVRRRRRRADAAGRHRRHRRRRGGIFFHFVQSELGLGRAVNRKSGRAHVVLEDARGRRDVGGGEYAGRIGKLPYSGGSVHRVHGIGGIRGPRVGNIFVARFVEEREAAIRGVRFNKPHDRGVRIGQGVGNRTDRVRCEKSPGIHVFHGRSAVAAGDHVIALRQIRQGRDLGEGAFPRIRRLRLRRRDAQSQRQRKPRAPLPHRRTTCLHVLTLFVFLNRGHGHLRGAFILPPFVDRTPFL